MKLKLNWQQTLLTFSLVFVATSIIYLPNNLLLAADATTNLPTIGSTKGLQGIEVPARIEKLYSCSENLAKKLGLEESGSRAGGAYSAIWSQDQQTDIYEKGSGDGYRYNCPESSTGGVLLASIGADGNGNCAMYTCDKSGVPQQIASQPINKEKIWDCESQKIDNRGDDWTDIKTQNKFDSSGESSRKYSAYCAGGGDLTVSHTDPQSSSCSTYVCESGVVRKVPSQKPPVIQDVTPFICNEELQAKIDNTDNWVPDGSALKVTGANGRQYQMSCSGGGAVTYDENDLTAVSCTSFSCEDGCIGLGCEDTAITQVAATSTVTDVTPFDCVAALQEKEDAAENWFAPNGSKEIVEGGRTYQVSCNEGGGSLDFDTDDPTTSTCTSFTCDSDCTGLGCEESAFTESTIVATVTDITPEFSCENVLNEKTSEDNWLVANNHRSFTLNGSEYRLRCSSAATLDIDTSDPYDSTCITYDCDSECEGDECWNTAVQNVVTSANVEKVGFNCSNEITNFINSKFSQWGYTNTEEVSGRNTATGILIKNRSMDADFNITANVEYCPDAGPGERLVVDRRANPPECHRVFCERGQVTSERAGNSRIEPINDYCYSNLLEEYKQQYRIMYKNARWYRAGEKAYSSDNQGNHWEWSCPTDAFINFEYHKNSASCQSPNCDGNNCYNGWDKHLGKRCTAIWYGDKYDTPTKTKVPQPVNCSDAIDTFKTNLANTNNNLITNLYGNQVSILEVKSQSPTYYGLAAGAIDRTRRYDCQPNGENTFPIIYDTATTSLRADHCVKLTCDESCKGDNCVNTAVSAEFIPVTITDPYGIDCPQKLNELIAGYKSRNKWNTTSTIIDEGSDTEYNYSCEGNGVLNFRDRKTQSGGQVQINPNNVNCKYFTCEYDTTYVPDRQNCDFGALRSPCLRQKLVEKTRPAIVNGRRINYKQSDSRVLLTPRWTDDEVRNYNYEPKCFLWICNNN